MGIVFPCHCYMKSIDVISIPVSNQQVAKAFYKKLGFVVLEEQKMEEGKYWIRMGLEGSSTTITLVTWFSKMQPGSMQGLVLRTDNLQEDIQLLKKEGILSTDPGEAAGGKFISFKDPDGNGISLQER